MVEGTGQGVVVAVAVAVAAAVRGIGNSTVMRLTFRCRCQSVCLICYATARSMLVWGT